MSLQSQYFLDFLLNFALRAELLFTQKSGLSGVGTDMFSSPSPVLNLWGNISLHEIKESCFLRFEFRLKLK